MLSLPPAGGTGKKINGASLFGKDRYGQYVREMNAHGTIEGIPLTKSERKEGFESRDSKINFEKFVGKVVTKKNASVKGTGSGSVPVGQKLLMGKNIQFSSEPFTAPDIPEAAPVQEEDLGDVGDKIDELIAEIKGENRADRKDANQERKRLEDERRAKREEMKEKVKSFIAAPIKKVLAPIDNIFSKIWKALTTILFSKILMKLIDWFTDPQNKKKVKALTKFIGQTWPVIVAGIVAVGVALNPFISWVVTAGAKLVAGLVKMTAKLAVALAKVAVRGARGALNLGKKGLRLLGTRFDDGGAIQGPSHQQGGVPIEAEGGEVIFSKKATNYWGTDNLLAMNAAGGGTNLPKLDTNEQEQFAGGGLVKVKGSGDGSTGKLTMHDKGGKQQGGSYGVISGLAGKGVATQKERMNISGQGLPMPDGDYPVHGFEEKKGGWKGLPGLGDWSAFVGPGSGMIGKRTGLMIHSDIDPYGTLGCLGVGLGGKPGTKAEQSFLRSYLAADPDKVSVNLLGGGTTTPTGVRNTTADNTLQLSGQTKGGFNAGAIGGAVKKAGQAVLQQLPTLFPTTSPPISATGGSSVPTLGSIDPQNDSLWYTKSLYNVTD